jgi:hypothetical protein
MGPVFTAAQQLAPNAHLDDLQKQGFSANQARNFYYWYDIHRNKLNFDIQTTNHKQTL